MQIFKQLSPYYWTGHLKVQISFSILFLMFSSLLGVAYPYLLKILVDDVILNENYELLFTLSFSVFAVIVLKASFQYFHGLWGGKTGNEFAFLIRESAYKKLQYLSSAYYDKMRTGDLMSRLTADLEAIKMFIGFGFAQLLNVFLLVFFSSMMMLFIHWKLMLITLINVPILLFIANRYESRVIPAFRNIRKSIADLNTAVQENISGVKTVKSFGRESYELSRFIQSNESYLTYFLNYVRIWANHLPFIEFISNLGIVVLLATGSYFILQNELTIGELLAFLSLIWFIINPMINLGPLVSAYAQAKAAAERVVLLLNQHHHVKDSPMAIDLPDHEFKGSVRFENVTFTYPEKSTPVISNFSLTMLPGTLTGILGPTGSGKSTIVQLLLRAYDLEQGNLFLDNHPIDLITIESLRRKMAIVNQESFLFSTSIKHNISFGVPRATMDEIIEAAKMAQAHEFISELPNGYDTLVGERGVGLSGGQKQRISIARAILKKPMILVLDDATSALDATTEQRIQQNLLDIMKNCTSLVISNRISAIKEADQIIVLNQGHILQSGTHQQLLDEPGMYQETYKIQYNDKL